MKTFSKKLQCSYIQMHEVPFDAQTDSVYPAIGLQASTEDVMVFIPENVSFWMQREENGTAVNLMPSVGQQVRFAD